MSSPIGWCVQASQISTRSPACSRALVQRLHPLCRYIGNAFQDLHVKYQPLATELSRVIQRLEPRDLAGPSPEIAPRLEFIGLFPKHQIDFL